MLADRSFCPCSSTEFFILSAISLALCADNASTSFAGSDSSETSSPCAGMIVNRRPASFRSILLLGDCEARIYRTITFPLYKKALSIPLLPHQAFYLKSIRSILSPHKSREVSLLPHVIRTPTSIRLLSAAITSRVTHLLPHRLFLPGSIRSAPPDKQFREANLLPHGQCFPTSIRSRAVWKTCWATQMLPHRLFLPGSIRSVPPAGKFHRRILLLQSPIINEVFAQRQKLFAQRRPPRTNKTRLPHKRQPCS